MLLEDELTAALLVLVKVVEKLPNGVATLAEFTQKVPTNWIKFWALSGLLTLV